VVVGTLSVLLALAARAAAAPSEDVSEAISGIDETLEGDGAAPLDEDSAHEDRAEELAGEWARSAVEAGATVTETALETTSGLVDNARFHERASHRGRVSDWGRFDVAVTWRRIDSETDITGGDVAGRAVTMTAPRRDELWLVATWRN